jgi:hypothetical protein
VVSTVQIPPPPRRDPNEGVVYLWIVLFPEEASCVCFSFRKRLSRKINNVLVFPFAFHITVEQPFKPLWSCLLLHVREPSQASFALCFKLLLMSLLPASGEFVWEFPFPRHLSLSGSYLLDLSSLADPTGSHATAGLAVRVTGTHKPLHHIKVEIPMEGIPQYTEIKCHVVLNTNVILCVLHFLLTLVAIFRSVNS